MFSVQIKNALLCSLLCVSLVPNSLAGDDFSHERSNMKAALKNVASDVEKNFYDPTLKGLDWKALTEQTKAKIDAAKSPGDMIMAIYVQLYKLNDSHTQFMPPSRNVKYFFGFDAKAIGSEIRIYELKSGDPADKAGLQLGDKIVSVNGFKAERNSYDIMMMDMKALRPRPSLELVVQTGSEAPRSVHLEARRKQEAHLQGVDTREGDIWDEITESENYSEEHKFMTGTYDKAIGYMWIRNFPAGGGDFLKGVAENVKGAKAVIVDLRSNPGGEIEAYKTFSGLFVANETTVMNMVSRKGSKPLTVKPQKPSFVGLPMYIIVDSRTGSAAEFFAKHFQLAGATVIGDQTPGRANWSKYFANTVGAENAMPYGSQISTDRAVFPNGDEVEHVGIKPDVYCIPTGVEMREDKDNCLNKALTLAREKLGIKSTTKETPEIKAATEN
jgi:carboxyl-terminal processing protease